MVDPTHKPTEEVYYLPSIISTKLFSKVIGKLYMIMYS